MNQRTARTYLIAGALVAATCIAYWPVRHNVFVDFDDPSYVTSNYHVLRGLQASEIRWVFSHPYYFNYHPLTLLSHMLDVQVSGLNPAAHHAVNVALHTINVLLLFLLLLRTTGAIGRSAFVAAAFALHPQHVESVAWIAERKDVLSGVFFLLALHAYVAYAQRPAWWRYGIVAVCIILGLLAKPMLVTLPFVLLLLDYWPLKRPVRYGFWRIVVEKIPLLLLSVESGVVTVIAQGSAVSSMAQVSLATRLMLIPLAYARYLRQFLWPSGLAVMYPIPRQIEPLHVAIAVIVLVIISLLAIRYRRQAPYFAIGWCWFCGMLVPVIGLVQVGAQAAADRYMYLPSIGLCIAIAWGLRDLARRWMTTRRGDFALGAAATVVLLAWLAVTMQQLRYWRDSRTLFDRAVAVSPDNPVMLADIGYVLMRDGHLNDAISYYRRALELAHFGDAYANLAVATLSQGNRDEARQLIAQGLEEFPNDPILQRSAGIVAARTGDLPAGVEHLNRAIRLDPSDLMARRILASVYVRMNETAKAMEEVQQVLAVAPDDPESIFNLATIQAARGDLPQAIENFRQYLAAKPDDAEAHFALAQALARSGDTNGSVRELHETLRCNPHHAAAIKQLDGR